MNVVSYTENTKIAVRDGQQNENLCLTLTLVNVRNNVNKNSKTFLTKQLWPSSVSLKSQLITEW